MRVERVPIVTGVGHVEHINECLPTNMSLSKGTLTTVWVKNHALAIIG
jgi:hypothetical protein